MNDKHFRNQLGAHRGATLTLVVIYLSTQVVFGYHPEKNIWDERRKTASLHRSIQAPLPSVSRPQLKTLPKNVTSIDAFEQLSWAHVRLNDVHIPKGDQQTKQFHFILQDIHQNPEAQKNIATVLEKLNPKVVALEGVKEKLDFSHLRQLPRPDLVRDVVNEMIDDREFTGPLRAGLSPNVTSRFVGVEDPTLYRQNVDAYRQASDVLNDVEQTLQKQEATLLKEKAHTLNPKLLVFDQHRRAYQDGTIKLGTYLKKLNGYALPLPLTLDRFLEATQLEEEMDFSQVERERRHVLNKLIQKSHEDEVSTLLAMSVAFRKGEMGHADFYRWLKTEIENVGIDLKTTPAFDEYVHYILLSEQIDVSKLDEGRMFLEVKIIDQLAKTGKEKELMRQSDELMLTKKLVRFELTSKEWEMYKKFHSSSPALVGEDTGGSSPSDRVRGHLPTKWGGKEELFSFENFYHSAEARNDVIVNRLSSFNEDSSVLVVGGFHTQGITQLFKEKNIGYAVLTPIITKVEGKASGYLSILGREKTPLEKLFEEDRLFIAHETLVPNGKPFVPMMADKLTWFQAVWAKFLSRYQRKIDKYGTAEENKLVSALSLRLPIWFEDEETKDEADSFFFTVFKVPALELQYMPGRAMLLFLVLFPFFGGDVALLSGVLAGSYLFARNHQNDTWLQLYVRFFFSVLITTVSIAVPLVAFFMFLSKGHLFALLFALSIMVIPYFLHMLYNLILWGLGLLWSPFMDYLLHARKSSSRRRKLSDVRKDFRDSNSNKNTSAFIELVERAGDVTDRESLTGRMQSLQSKLLPEESEGTNQLVAAYVAQLQRRRRPTTTLPWIVELSVDAVQHLPAGDNRNQLLWALAQIQDQADDLGREEIFNLTRGDEESPFFPAAQENRQQWVEFILTRENEILDGDHFSLAIFNHLSANWDGTHPATEELQLLASRAKMQRLMGYFQEFRTNPDDRHLDEIGEGLYHIRASEKDQFDDELSNAFLDETSRRLTSGKRDFEFVKKADIPYFMRLTWALDHSFGSREKDVDHISLLLVHVVTNWGRENEEFPQLNEAILYALFGAGTFDVETSVTPAQPLHHRLHPDIIATMARLLRSRYEFRRGESEDLLRLEWFFYNFLAQIEHIVYQAPSELLMTAAMELGVGPDVDMAMGPDYDLLEYSQFSHQNLTLVETARLSDLLYFMSLMNFENNNYLHNNIHPLKTFQIRRFFGEVVGRPRDPLRLSLARGVIAVSNNWEEMALLTEESEQQFFTQLLQAITVCYQHGDWIATNQGLRVLQEVTEWHQNVRSQQSANFTWRAAEEAPNPDESMTIRTMRTVRTVFQTHGAILVQILGHPTPEQPSPLQPDLAQRAQSILAATSIDADQENPILDQLQTSFWAQFSALANVEDNDDPQLIWMIQGWVRFMVALAHLLSEENFQEEMWALFQLSQNSEPVIATTAQQALALIQDIFATQPDSRIHELVVQMASVRSIFQMDNLTVANNQRYRQFVSFVFQGFAWTQAEVTSILNEMGQRRATTPGVVQFRHSLEIERDLIRNSGVLDDPQETENAAYTSNLIEIRRLFDAGLTNVPMRTLNQLTMVYQRLPPFEMMATIFASFRHNQARRAFDADSVIGAIHTLLMNPAQASQVGWWTQEQRNQFRQEVRRLIIHRCANVTTLTSTSPNNDIFQAIVFLHLILQEVPDIRGLDSETIFTLFDFYDQYHHDGRVSTRLLQLIQTVLDVIAHDVRENGKNAWFNAEGRRLIENRFQTMINGIEARLETEGLDELQSRVLPNLQQVAFFSAGAIQSIARLTQSEDREVARQAMETLDLMADQLEQVDSNPWPEEETFELIQEFHRSFFYLLHRQEQEPEGALDPRDLWPILAVVMNLQHTGTDRNSSSPWFAVLGIMRELVQSDLPFVDQPHVPMAPVYLDFQEAMGRAQSFFRLHEGDSLLDTLHNAVAPSALQPHFGQAAMGGAFQLRLPRWFENPDTRDRVGTLWFDVFEVPLRELKWLPGTAFLSSFFIVPLIYFAFVLSGFSYIDSLSPALVLGFALASLINAILFALKHGSIHKKPDNEEGSQSLSQAMVRAFVSLAILLSSFMIPLMAAGDIFLLAMINVNVQLLISASLDLILSTFILVYSLHALWNGILFGLGKMFPVLKKYLLHSYDVLGQRQFEIMRRSLISREKDVRDGFALRLPRWTQDPKTRNRVGTFWFDVIEAPFREIKWMPGFLLTLHAVALVIIFLFHHVVISWWLNPVGIELFFAAGIVIALNVSAFGSAAYFADIHGDITPALSLLRMTGVDRLELDRWNRQTREQWWTRFGGASLIGLASSFLSLGFSQSINVMPLFGSVIPSQLIIFFAGTAVLAVAGHIIWNFIFFFVGKKYLLNTFQKNEAEDVLEKPQSLGFRHVDNTAEGWTEPASEEQREAPDESSELDLAIPIERNLLPRNPLRTLRHFRRQA